MNPSDQKNQKVIWIVFFITIVFSMLGHILIYFFEEKIKVIPSLSKNDSIILTDSEISLQSVIITGIRKELSAVYVQRNMEKLFMCKEFVDRLGDMKINKVKKEKEKDGDLLRSIMFQEAPAEKE